MPPVRKRVIVAVLCVLTGLALGVGAGLLFAFAGLIATPSRDAAVDAYSSGTLERNIVTAFAVCTLLGLLAGIALAVLIDVLWRRRHPSSRPPASWSPPRRPG
jgi:drug/metabolite transporter (DMT)-like permease